MKGNKKKFIAIGTIALAVLAGVITLIVVFSNKQEGSKQANEADKKVALQIVLKDIVMLKDEELSEKAIDYLETYPEDMDETKLSVDTTSVDTSKEGNYIYKIKYNSMNATGYILIVGSEEELAKEIEENSKATLFKEKEEGKEAEPNPSDSGNTDPGEKENPKPAEEKPSNPSKPSTGNGNTSTGKNPDTGGVTIDGDKTIANDKENEVVETPSFYQASPDFTATHFSGFLGRYSNPPASVADLYSLSSNGWNGSYYLKFSKPVNSKYTGNAFNHIYDENSQWASARAKAKQVLGEEGCVASIETYYVNNKDNYTIGLALKINAGTLNHDYSPASCSNNETVLWGSNNIAVN